MKKRNTTDDGKLDLFEIVVITFTLYILGSLIWQSCFDLEPEILKLLSIFDFISCIIFMIDWGIRYQKAIIKWKYTLYNLLDLIASIPVMVLFEVSGYAKAIQLIRLIRFIKIIGGINRLISYKKTNEISLLKISFLVTFILVMLCSPVLILVAEQKTGNIQTAWDSLWWTWCTLTTIGYGDFYPVTGFGRILTVVVTMGGIALFGIASTLIINKILKINLNDEKN